MSRYIKQLIQPAREMITLYLILNDVWIIEEVHMWLDRLKVSFLFEDRVVYVIQPPLCPISQSILWSVEMEALIIICTKEI